MRSAIEIGRCAIVPLGSLALLGALSACGASSPSEPAGVSGAGNVAGAGNWAGAGSATAGAGGAAGVTAGGGDAAAGSPSAGTAGDGAAGSATGGQPGAGGGTGGGSTAGSAGASGGAPPSATCPSGALLCDDFESFSAMAPPNGKWTSRTNGTASVVVDTLHAHSGTKAVHFHAANVNNGQRAYILTQGAPVFPVTTDTLYVRFMLYIGRYVSVAGTSIHNRIAWVGSAATLASGGNGPGYSFATYNGIAIERLTNPSQGFQRNTAQKMDEAARQNKWQCFEFEIDNKGGVPAGEQPTSTTRPHIWQEGTELSLSAAGSSEPWLPAPFEALQFSLWCPQTDPMPTDYWIDDVVMSKERIQCPASQ